jgi:rare lipoprotein A
MAIVTGVTLLLTPALACADGPARPAGSAARPHWAGQTGTASYYGKAHHGKRTASGARFNQHALTAAHPTLPFGTRVRVVHRISGRSIVVEINDRLPSKRRMIDLSYGAARELGILRLGVAEVELRPV